MSHQPSLTHWGRVTHICVGKLTNIGSDNGLSPGRRQAIIWTNAGILLIRSLETNSIEILIKIHTFSFRKMHLKMSSGKWGPFCLGLNMLTHWSRVTHICVHVGNLTSKECCWLDRSVEFFIEIHTFSFKKMHLKTSSAKWRPFCLNVWSSDVYILYMLVGGSQYNDAVVPV